MRNLIPMLMFVMSWPLIVCTPGRHAFDKTELPQKAIVSNAHKSERQKKWDTCVKAKRYLDSLANAYQDTSKGTSKRQGSQDRILKKARNKFYEAKDQFLEANKWWFCVEEDIREYNTIHLAGDRQLNALKGDNNQLIYIFIERRKYVKDIFGMEDTNGATFWAYDTSKKQFYADVRAETKNDAFLVRLKTSAKDVGQIIAHEQGHIIDIIKRRPVYMARLGEWNSLDCQARENRYHTFVEPAKAAELAFIDLENRAKHRYRRKEYDKRYWLAWVDSSVNRACMLPL